jgi:hypothetical protein
MAQPQRVLPKRRLPAAQPRQINISFESRWLQGLKPLERMRALTLLATLLMLAAGVATQNPAFTLTQATLP